MNSLPNGWRAAKIQELVTRTKQRDPSKQPDESFRYVDVSSVSNTLFKIVSDTKMLGAEAPSRARKEIKAKDVLFATVRPTLKRIALVPQDLDGEIASTGYCVLRPEPDKIVPEFLYHSLLTDNFVKAMGGLERGVSYPAIRDTDVLSATILLPSLGEQGRIARVLSTVQTAIEQQARLIDLTRELKRAFTRKLFTESLHGEKQKETEIGLVPKSWDVVALREAVEYIDYGYSAPIPKTAPENGIKIVSTADINRAGEMLYWKMRRTTAPEKTIKRLTLLDGDVLFNWRNSAELIGKTSIFEQQSEPHIFASFVLRIRCDEKNTHNYFLKHLLNHYREQEVFVKLSRRAVNQANYNRNEIFELKIPFPKYEEQREIAETILAVENKLLLHESKRNLLEELFRNLLHQLMTGRIRVNELDFGLFETQVSAME